MKVDKLFIYCDGGARGNPGPAAAAFVAKDLDNNLIFREGKYLGESTNNRAEYDAVILALEWVAKNHADIEIVFFLDSQLVVNQIKGLFKIKDKILQEKVDSINKIISQNKLKVRNYLYVPRKVNYEADSLVNETMDQNII